MDITISNLTKRYDGKPVLQNVSAILAEGQTTVLMGTSGAGKTTLGKILLGLERQDAGTIEGLSGKRLSAVFQENRLCEQLTGLGNIRLVLKQKPERQELLRHFEEVELYEDDAKKPVHFLSGGQKRRIAILRAVLAESDFICLDEPFQGMDQDTKEKTMAYVKHAIAGKTVLLITHDRQDAEYFGGARIELFQSPNS